MNLHRVSRSSTFMARLPHGCDLIEVFDGPQLERTFDEQTGLGLWKNPNNLNPLDNF